MPQCEECGAPLFLDWCEACSHRAANDPAFAATEAGQRALAAAARIATMARRSAMRELTYRGGTVTEREITDTYYAAEPARTTGRLSSVPYAGDPLDLLDAGEREMLRYQRESR